jgi:hypothetical protein
MMPKMSETVYWLRNMTWLGERLDKMRRKFENGRDVNNFEKITMYKKWITIQRSQMKRHKSKTKRNWKSKAGNRRQKTETTRRPSRYTGTAYCVTFLLRQPSGQWDTHVMDAGQTFVEPSPGIKLCGSENCSGFEFRELIIIINVTLYNIMK